MITAVDSNVLLDVLQADPTFGPRSARALRACLAEGSVVACEVVWAEVSAWFPTAADAEDALGRLDVRFDPLDHEAAGRAGTMWRSYRMHGGARNRIIADFVIGAHALGRADRLLSRDRGFYRARFGQLNVLDPARR